VIFKLVFLNCNDWRAFPDYHWTIKNVVKLDNYFTPEELEAALKKFVN
jgi:hypothetical protein